MLTACTSCGAKIRVSDDAAGKKGKCPRCGVVFTIAAPEPEPPTTPPPLPDEPAATAVTESAGPPPLPPTTRRARYDEEEDEDDEPRRRRGYGSIRRPRGDQHASLATAAMICGIVALVLTFGLACCCPYVGLVPSVLAIVFGFLSMHGSNRGMAISGIIMGFIAVALVVAVIVLNLVGFGFHMMQMQQFPNRGRPFR
jgi:predicted Zn finger-like uncharacterized protein